MGDNMQPIVIFTWLLIQIKAKNIPFSSMLTYFECIFIILCNLKL